LHALDVGAREQFLADLARLGEAVFGATGALRINYAIFGNVEPALHAHVHPRFVDEPAAMRNANPWGYDWALAPAFDLPIHAALRDDIRCRLLGSSSVGAPEHSARLHHIDLTVAELERSTSFYDRWLTAMGFVRINDVSEGPLWRSSGFEFGLQQAAPQLASRPHDRRAVGLHHIAFAAPSCAAVEQLHAELRAAGVVILDPPAFYEQYAPGYFAVFFVDPDGIKLEYVFTPSM
jgi:catechol 2,3-dioxygenase-like lactoylglutathione lyase family enzyme